MNHPILKNDGEVSLFLEECSASVWGLVSAFWNFFQNLSRWVWFHATKTPATESASSKLHALKPHALARWVFRHIHLQPGSQWRCRFWCLYWSSCSMSFWFRLPHFPTWWARARFQGRLGLPKGPNAWLRAVRSSTTASSAPAIRLLCWQSVRSPAKHSEKNRTSRTALILLDHNQVYNFN